MSQSMDKRKGEKIRKGIKPPLTAKTELRKEILFEKKTVDIVVTRIVYISGTNKTVFRYVVFFSTH